MTDGLRASSGAVGQPNRIPPVDVMDKTAGLDWGLRHT